MKPRIRKKGKDTKSNSRYILEWEEDGKLMTFSLNPKKMLKEIIKPMFKEKKEFLLKNPSSIERKRKYMKEYLRNYSKKYKEQNREKINKRARDDWKKPNINIKLKLRHMLRYALNNYSINGKIKVSKDYGINFEEIIKQLQPFPKNMENYHIDHIIPLSWFDFNNPKEIKWAFAPENHQWLTAEENIQKNNKFLG